MKKIIKRGLIGAIPLMVVASLLLWLVELVLQYPWYYPIIVVGGIFGLGLALSTKVGSWIHNKWELLVDKFPVINGIYDFSKQVSEIVIDTETFQTAVLVSPHRAGTYQFGFLTNQPEKGVFVPSVPNPASGNYYLVKDYKVLANSPVDVLKHISSLGTFPLELKFKEE